MKKFNAIDLLKTPCFSHLTVHNSYTEISLSPCLEEKNINDLFMIHNKYNTHNLFSSHIELKLRDYLCLALADSE